MLNQPTQVCRQCLRELPLTQFRRHHKGKEARRYQCNECHHVDLRMRRISAKSKRLVEFVQQLASERYSDKWVVRELVEHVLYQFQGTRGLARFWHEQAQACRPGSRLGIYTLPAVARLMRLAEQPDPRPTKNLEALDEDELDAELREEIARLVEERAQQLLREYIQAERRASRSAEPNSDS